MSSNETSPATSDGISENRDAILGGAALVIGWLFAVLALPLYTGTEELTRWDTMAFANKTALYFLLLGGIGLIGGVQMARTKKPLAKAALMAATMGAVVLVAAVLSTLTPFGIG
jgi:peptidoglycan/LPS O-acetylase OafA/YrhL